MRLLLLVLITTNVSASAFTTTNPSAAQQQRLQQHIRTTTSNNVNYNSNSLLTPTKNEGSATATTTTSSSIMSTPATAVPAGGGAPTKRIRISAFDSMRFFLIMGIVMGHFISFANPSTFIFKAASQHNVIVGAFFALSGYVTAYTSTEQGQRAASSKLLETPKQKWTLSRIFGYFPLHLLVLALFSPMFLYTDLHYSGWPTAAINAALSTTMTQAWSPQHAEIWNAPTWFLSALSFVTATLPFSLPSIAKMDKNQLKKTGMWLFIVNLLPKLGYCFDHKMWAVAEGITSPKAMPAAMAVFNLQRFLPLGLVAEVMLGVVACRLVMLDGAALDKDKSEEKPATNSLSTLLPLVSLVGLTVLRASGMFEINDLIFRSVLFVPLFLKLLMSVHRNTVSKTNDPIVNILSNKILIWLGSLTFPIFILHGPVGQVFFKKLIATKIFGQVYKGPGIFGIYLATTMLLAYIIQNTFLKSKAVANWSKKTVDQLSSWM